jgi:hypothetical protein
MNDVKAIKNNPSQFWTEMGYSLIKVNSFLQKLAAGLGK